MCRYSFLRRGHYLAPGNPERAIREWNDFGARGVGPASGRGARGAPDARGCATQAWQNRLRAILDFEDCQAFTRRVPRRARKQMTPIRTLVDRDQNKSEPALPPGLRDLYDGDLHFQTSPAERPYVFANFVSTLDGVVSYAIKGQASGSVISGYDPADRFIMGLLRLLRMPSLLALEPSTIQDHKVSGLLNPSIPMRNICTGNTELTFCINRRACFSSS